MSSLYVILFLVLHSCGHSDGSLKQIATNLANAFPRTLGIPARAIFALNEARSGKQLVTDLDLFFRNIFIMLRHLTLRYFYLHIDEILESQRIHGKLQEVVPETIAFPCNLTAMRSFRPPNSVHRVRPGDIDVIASLGDSLSAGNGIISENVGHILNENRGVSFTGGGLGTWREFLTLPNILKVFNPQLYGYSTSHGLVVDESSHLNIAEPMIMSRDLPFQARLIIDRMRQDSRVDMKNHWKLLTIFLGNNDVCSDMCHYDDEMEFLSLFEKDLREGLRLLRDHIPRLIVNLVPAPNMVTTLYPMRNIPLVCHGIHLVGCHCVFSSRIQGEKLRAVYDLIVRWQEVEKYVASLSEFQTKDFTVIYQPFTSNATVPTLPNGDTDLRFVASDCFHFSQRGHAAMANSLWNNMLQPLGQKKADGITLAFEHFVCPSAKRPYIATWKNSVTD